ncbi:MAG: hypothetical protein ACK5CL_06390 [Sphingomonadales bacterium]
MQGTKISEPNPKYCMKLKTVILGTQRKAEIFSHLLNGSNLFEFRGFYDPDSAQNADAAGNLIFTLELSEKADVFIIDRHVHNLDVNLIDNLTRLGKHILLDGFLIQHTGFIEQLIRLHAESGNCFHVANTLYNKPLYTTASQFVRKPRFIKLEKECRPPAPGGFEAWLFKELAQDLDLVIRTAQSGIRDVSARPLFLFGKNPDLLNIHIEFDNDSVCHITAGRAIEPGTHRMKIYQQDKLFSLDFVENTLNEYRQTENRDQLSILEDSDAEQQQELTLIQRPVIPFDSWKMEFRNFEENIIKGLTPLTSLENLLEVNRLSSLITEKVQRRYHEV